MSFIKRCWQGIKIFCKRYDKILIGAVLGSFVTIIAAIFVNYAAQKHIAERAHQSEIHKRNLNMRETIFNEVHDLVATHMFRLDRFVWAYQVKRVNHKDLKRYWND